MGTTHQLTLPARDPSLVSVTQVLNAVRITRGRSVSYRLTDCLHHSRLKQYLTRMKQTLETSVGDITLRDLATQDTENILQDATKQDW